MLIICSWCYGHYYSWSTLITSIYIVWTVYYYILFSRPAVPSPNSWKKPCRGACARPAERTDFSPKVSQSVQFITFQTGIEFIHILYKESIINIRQLCYYKHSLHSNSILHFLSKYNQIFITISLFSILLSYTVRGYIYLRHNGRMLTIKLGPFFMPPRRSRVDL